MRDYKTKAFLALISVKNAFKNAGFEIAINTPFAGSIVTLEYYGKDNRVSCL